VTPWYKRPRLVALMLFSLALVVYGIRTASSNVFLGNVAFLVLGVLLVYVIGLEQEDDRRKQTAKDLSASLYVELAYRFARCCYDCEHPWGGRWDKPEQMQPHEVLKFAPVPPVIYPAAADQIALLGSDAMQALVQFYYRLESYRRELENFAAVDSPFVPERDIKLLAIRLHQTLVPGRTAVEALGTGIDWQSVEHSAMTFYETGGKQENHPKGTLRDRANELIMKRGLR
jgi:hypothetical protein